MEASRLNPFPWSKFSEIYMEIIRTPCSGVADTMQILRQHDIIPSYRYVNRSLNAILVRSSDAQYVATVFVANLSPTLVENSGYFAPLALSRGSENKQEIHHMVTCVKQKLKYDEARQHSLPHSQVSDRVPATFVHLMNWECCRRSLENKFQETLETCRFGL